MKSLRVSVFALVSLCFSIGTGVIDSSAQVPYGGIKLLDGYKLERTNTLGVLSASGRIVKDGGLLIEFEEGMSQGHAVDRERSPQYSWHAIQTIGGQVFKIAMIKPGLKTVWEPDRPRNANLGSILLITIPLGDDNDNAVNFRAEILNENELVEALLMVLTFRADTR